ncbi:interleukin-15 [Embiotoca jacksoni]|uniref:interleukin-15 n=1 Tax=Embiotoca jacksoni TaxID=100190 RepID=UPI00370386C0
MTDFMTSFLVILFNLTCHGDQRAKGAQIQPTFSLCRESHKTQVWLCFLVLSLLSTSTCAMPETADLQSCVTMLVNSSDVKKSDAMLYAPSNNDIEENCINMLLKCYMLELMMVINELDIKGNPAQCIFHFNEALHPEVNVDCPPCEAYSLNNITIFLDRLNYLLEKMNVLQYLPKT